MSEKVMQWLLQGDSAIRWQVQRDLLGTSEAIWRDEQRRVAEEGWGSRLLGERTDEGIWDDGLYTPKWTSTTYTMILLRRLGLPREHPEAIASTELLMRKQIWLFGPRKTYWEACVAGFALGLSSWFDVDPQLREDLADEVLDAQMPDGGWNCRRPRGAKHSSFHTTINVLEGLREYVETNGDQAERVQEAEARAREFFCQHQLYRSHRTGEVVDARMARLSFPPRWKHDILRTLDYFRASAAAPDPRLEDPISVLRNKQRADGRWPVQQRHPGKVWFLMEPTGQPSRWNTLRARRVLQWWRQD